MEKHLILMELVMKRLIFEGIIGDNAIYRCKNKSKVVIIRSASFDQTT